MEDPGSSPPLAPAPIIDLTDTPLRQAQFEVEAWFQRYQEWNLSASGVEGWYAGVCWIYQRLTAALWRGMDIAEAQGRTPAEIGLIFHRQEQMRDVLLGEMDPSDSKRIDTVIDHILNREEHADNEPQAWIEPPGSPTAHPPHAKAKEE